MASFTVSTQQVNQLGLRKITIDGFTEQEPTYSRVFRVETSDRPYEELFLTGDIPPVPQVKSEVSPTPVVDIDVSNPVRFVHGEYRQAVAYTQRALRHDRYGIQQDKVKKIGKAARTRIELSAASIFNDLTRTGGWDSATLFNGAHKLLSTTATYSNKTGIGMGPGPGALSALYNYGALMPDESGYPSLKSKLIGIGCHPKMAPSWRALLGPIAITSYPNNTQANPGLKNAYSSLLSPDSVIEMPWLVDETFWFGIYAGHQLRFFWEDKPTVYQVKLDDPQAFKHIVLMRYSLGWLEAKGVYGNAL